MSWENMKSAPKDGTVLLAGTAMPPLSYPWHPIKSKWVRGWKHNGRCFVRTFLPWSGGAWCANFGTDEKPDWVPYSPQPTI